mmetsp:Transcript_4295/g.16121  ORF Transcript_4295/g.16121 Transcript_4295/m.16121 type:complete len:211 (-) Transcript_4295:442-1074(-)
MREKRTQLRQGDSPILHECNDATVASAEVPVRIVLGIVLRVHHLTNHAELSQELALADGSVGGPQECVKLLLVNAPVTICVQGLEVCVVMVEHGALRGNHLCEPQELRLAENAVAFGIDHLEECRRHFLQRVPSFASGVFLQGVNCFLKVFPDPRECDRTPSFYLGRYIRLVDRRLSRIRSFRKNPRYLGNRVLRCSAEAASGKRAAART